MQPARLLPVVGAAGLCSLLIPQHIDPAYGAYPRALAVACALFLVPGWLLAKATAFDRSLAWPERFAVYFVASAGLITPLFLAPLATGSSLTAFLPAYAALIVVLVVAGSRVRGVRVHDLGVLASYRPPLLLTTLVVVALLLLTAGAWQLTATGSIDRWWYLAYVRSYMQAPELSLGEPFLTGELVVPRFAFHSWLLAMALWARQANVDPVWLFERVCPLLLVPAAFSAALFFATSLFDRGRAAWMSVLISALLWTGYLFPILTRIPEDKFYALMVLAPVVVGTFIRAVRDGDRCWLWLLAAATVALGTCHALIYAFALLLLVPYLVLCTLSGLCGRGRAAVLVCVLALGALYPTYTGFASRTYLGDTGASLETPDHPVVRVHLRHDRLFLLEGGSYVVQPWLLFMHPLTLVALLGLPLALRRRPEERNYLVPATVIPLAFAFVPPLAVVAGGFILPWMVHRLLWVVPFAPLVAIVAEAAARPLRRLAWIVPLILVAIALPSAIASVDVRVGSNRMALALPAEGPARRALDTIASLAPDAVIAAPSDISDRIPAVTGRRVLAAGDRATVVFSGSREVGELRLRARAAVMHGSWEARRGWPAPTHLLFAPGAAAERHCGKRVFKSRGFWLCEFDAGVPDPAEQLHRLAAGSPAPNAVTVSLHEVLSGRDDRFSVYCAPRAAMKPYFLHLPSRVPWLAEPPRLLCTVTAGTASARLRLLPRSLTVTPFLGRATDEISLSVEGLRSGRRWWVRRTSRRVAEGEPLRFALPEEPVDELRIAVASDFLPFAKLRDMEISFLPAESEKK